jgi:serine/threonine protein kinase
MATRVVPQPGEALDTADVSREASAQDVPCVPTHLGDFRLLRRLGQGAMAVVYKAQQLSLDRPVALKILFPHVAANPKLRERFYREARILGQLDHPNIVQGYAVGEENGLHYCAMEFVDGESLQRWLARLGRLSVGDAVHIALACARALDYAHGLGLIHRDVKPDNILITRQGQVKLTDLGMVKQLDEDLSLTQTGHGVGTPWYMPLEQARNAKETDARSDIYALGCTLYHALTGRPPFFSTTLIDLIREKQIGTFPPARQFNPEIPERLDLIIAKMAAKLPQHRYQNCAEVIRELQALHLASATLTFLRTTEPADEQAPAPPPGPGSSSAENTAAVSSAAASAEKSAEETVHIWYVRYRKANGLVVQKQMTTDEILKRIGDGRLGPSAQASRQPHGHFRALATYREFEPALLARLKRPELERQTARYRSLYQQIEEQERQREEPEAEDPIQSNVRYWMELAAKLSIPVLGLMGLVFFLRWLAAVLH